MVQVRRLTAQLHSLDTGNTDLPRLACNAAFELDNILIGAYADLGEIECLAKLLIQQDHNDEAGGLILDPTTIMVMSMAIDDAEPELQLTKTGEVIEETGKMGNLLRQVAANPKSVDAAELRKLRNYCLALNERASGNEQSVDEWEPKNSWRR